jgi:oligopeptidase A
MSELSQNPLYAYEGLPPFEQIEAAHVVPAIRAHLAQVESALAAHEKVVAPTWESAVVALRDIFEGLGRAWGPVSHLMGVRNSPELRAAYEEVQGEVVMLSLRAGQSEPLYRALRGLRDSAGWSNLTRGQQRIVEQKLQAAEQAGIGLQGEARERFNSIAQELSALGTTYSNHVLDATRSFGIDITDSAALSGVAATGLMLLSSAWNQAHNADTSTPESGPWRATLDMPVYLAVMEYAENRALREQLYRAYVTRASTGETDNLPLVQQILRLRREKAQLLGFENYAELSLSTKMADLPGVRALSEELLSAAAAVGPSELQQVRDFAAAQGESAELSHWDLPLWRRRLRESLYAYTDEELRPYFPLNKVLDGLFALLDRLFAVTVRPADGAVQVWHPDVRYFEMFNEAGDKIAAFFLDAYSRPGLKRGGAWMNDCQERWLRPEGLQLPVAYLICNQTPPVGDRPSLMTFDEVETLFHEFGHGLQHMLTQVDEPEVAGISGIEWDAVELPSQFMENWCYHRATLLGMTGHFETGAPLPDATFDKLVAARTFQAATFMMRQLMLGMTDMSLHADYDARSGERTPLDVMTEVAARTALLPPLAEDRFLCSFSHIFAGGYAAGYYSYKWAEVLSADAFGAFTEAGLDNSEGIARAGRLFRDTVLALGGSVEPMEVYRRFRGRAPSTKALLEQYGFTV